MTESDPQSEQLAPVAPATPPVSAPAIAPPVAAPPSHPVAPPMPQPPTGYGPAPAAQLGFPPSGDTQGQQGHPGYPPPGAIPNGYALPPGYAAPTSSPNPAYQGYSVPPPGWAQAGAPVSAPVARGLSIASLITAMIGLSVSFPMAAVGLLFGVCGVVFGFVAKRKEPRATGLWLTGIIIGFVAITCALVAFTVVLVLGSTRGFVG